MADQHALELIQEEKWDQFNAYAKSKGDELDLTNAHLRGYDLRKCNLTQADLSGAYLRSCDLRGLDLSCATLMGASMKDARLSGVLFPARLSAQEITMSVEHGTRLRVQ